jgi:hypothetical protein
MTYLLTALFVWFHLFLFVFTLGTVAAIVSYLIIHIERKRHRATGC